jgi:hypothetical protein
MGKAFMQHCYCLCGLVIGIVILFLIIKHVEPFVMADEYTLLPGDKIVTITMNMDTKGAISNVVSDDKTVTIPASSNSTSFVINFPPTYRLQDYAVQLLSSGSNCNVRNAKNVSLYTQNKDGTCWVRANYDAGDSGASFISVINNDNKNTLHTNSFSLAALKQNVKLPLQKPISGITFKNLLVSKDVMVKSGPNIKIQLSVKTK